MLVRFKVNLGSGDASRLGLDFQKCKTGMELNCGNDVGGWLVAKKLATEVRQPEAIGAAKAPTIADAKPVEMKAVQPEPLAAKAFDKSPPKQGK